MSSVLLVLTTIALLLDVFGDCSFLQLRISGAFAGSCSHVPDYLNYLCNLQFLAHFLHNFALSRAIYGVDLEGQMRILDLKLF